MLLCMLAQKFPALTNGYVWANSVSTCICHVTWSFTGPLHATIPFQFSFGFCLISLDPYISRWVLQFTWNVTLYFAWSFYIPWWSFSLSLETLKWHLTPHLKFHLTTRSYHVILTSTWAFHLDFHLIPAVDLVIHLSSSHDISCAQWFLRSQGSQDVPDAEGMPSVCFTFSFPQNMNAKEGTSPVKPVETLVQTYVLSFFSL